MSASCPQQKFHSSSRFPSLFLSSLASFSVLFCRPSPEWVCCIVICINSTPLKWLMEQKNPCEVCKRAARYNKFGHNPYASVIAFFSKKDNHKILYPFPNDNPQNKIGKDVLFVDRKLQCRRFIKISSLRKQLTFRYTTTGFPVKWCLRNERRKSILMTCHWEI